ncbi:MULTISPECIES: DNA-binding transcriptional regulator CsiR [unclassified Halomonas]|uniref:DNA-binding transcriptional regulator CsiR n=1 Tax=unclassified Halomonas TaxID=2609666 RepID=UPI0021E3B0E2|nr:MULTISPECIES: DNA-binding transcriptional regulator CsiR [unclassified Halomonas]UYF99174.1 DNA-binding transcriptional regulator CsiR [Halomonas sp. GD1P12]WNL39669.1 DNA-binding transcriptional regulator CsiR [Halomonas sp. PAMB 3232]WNL43029.1 DNA-binding transcriptional regulator CsiR [Halomonas sp. PAMB 3264]
MDTSLPRPNLAINAYRDLKRDIIRGRYPAGEKLLMSRLKEHYGLSTGPLREALSQLVADRLVIAISQRGYRVAPMSLSELRDIYDARAQLEGLVLKLAIERGDDDWEAEVLATAHRLGKVTNVSSPEALLDTWDARHQAFHTAIASGCNSPHLLQMRETLFSQVERYRHLWLKQTVMSPAALSRKHDEHSALVEVILARDAERAAVMMRDHLMTPVPIITELLRERGID